MFITFIETGKQTLPEVWHFKTILFSIHFQFQGSAAAPQQRVSLKFKFAGMQKKKFPKRWIVCLETGLGIQMNLK